MASFGRASMKNLSTCDPKLQVLFKEVVKHIDCSVLCGHRTKEEQDALQGFDLGRTVSTTVTLLGALTLLHILLIGWILSDLIVSLTLFLGWRLLKV